MTLPPNRWNVLLLLPGVLALGVITRVGSAIAARLLYPFDLEWMEGGVLAHAWRVKHGLPIYAPPSAEFIPMVYPPGYYDVVATLSWVFGLSAPLGRSVSIVGTLAAAAALVWVAHRRFGNPLLGLLGAGVFIGCFEDSGAFYDLVRPDALAMGLLAWSLVLATESSRRALVVSGLLLALAFGTKHNAAAYGVPMALGLWAWRGTRPALWFGLAAAVPAGLFTLVMQLSTDGHFLGYLIDVPASHPSVMNRFVPGTVREIGTALPIVTAALAAWALSATPRAAPGLPVPLHVVPGALAAFAAVWVIGDLPEVMGIPDATPLEATAAALAVGTGLMAVLTGAVGSAIGRRVDGPWAFGAGVLLTAFVTAGMMRAHHGGFMNVFIPLHWVLSAALVALLADVLEELPGAKGSVLASSVALLQLTHHWNRLELDRLVPDEVDVAAGQEVVAALVDRPGPVLSPFAPWIAAMAGHPPGFHLIALWDVRHPGGPYHKESGDVLEAIQQHHYGTVVDAPEGMGFGLSKAYVRATVIPLTGRALMPRTGWRRRPGVIWVPNPELKPSQPIERSDR